MKITLITVTYNAENLLEETIKSVLGQKLNENLEIEYWLIDGGSKDRTVEIIQKYAKHLAGWISEKDKGIYDAMNKGIERATGEWIGFMNAGDRFENEEVIQKMFGRLEADSELIYGNYHIEYQTFAKPKKVPAHLDDFWKGMILNHQSIFVKTVLAKQFPFDTQYKLAGDFAQLYGFYRQGRKFQYVDMFVARFADGGESARRKVACIKEIQEIVSKYLESTPQKYFFEKLILKTKFIAFLKQILPSAVFEKLMQLKNQ